jgi:hypothetical protein
MGRVAELEYRIRIKADQIMTYEDTPEMVAHLRRLADEADEDGRKIDAYWMRESAENLQGLWTTITRRGRNE